MELASSTHADAAAGRLISRNYPAVPAECLPAFDVVVTTAIFEELIKKARWSELVQWSGEPALYTKFHFGKYRGRRYDEIAASDPDYLRWIIEKSELEEGIKHSARYWLLHMMSQR